MAQLLPANPQLIWVAKGGSRHCPGTPFKVVELLAASPDWLPKSVVELHLETSSYVSANFSLLLRKIPFSSTIPKISLFFLEEIKGRNSLSLERKPQKIQKMKIARETQNFLRFFGAIFHLQAKRDEQARDV